MSAKEIELEIKRKEIELRILRIKLSVIKSMEHKIEDKGLMAIANKYKDAISLKILCLEFQKRNLQT